jgi:hypothetical protein
LEQLRKYKIILQPTRNWKFIVDNLTFSSMSHAFWAFIFVFSILSFNTFAQFPSGGGRLSGFGNSSTPPQRPTSTSRPNTSAFGNKLFEEKRDTTRVIIPDSLKSKDSGLQSTVTYVAEDSTVMDVDGKVVNLYGKSKVTYGDIELEADYIRLDWGKSEVFAHGSPDSTKKGEKVKGKPVFSQSGDKYNTDTIRYNFKSRKALIKGIVTQQGEGYVTGERVKKDANDDLYLVDAKYTTCNLKEPHFHISARKIKLVNKKQVISGPFNFVLNNIPLPIGLPFGFFPIPKKKEAGTSGILMGTYGEDANQRGFYLQNFGYYFAINERVGLTVTSQIYSKGSWGVGLQSTYSKRYKYTGNLNFQYNRNNNVPEVVASTDSKKNYITKDFNLSWSHTPANKRPDRSFSSSVNLRSNGFNRNNAQTSDVSNYTSNEANSGVQISRTFAQKIVLSGNLNISQNFEKKLFGVSSNYSLNIPSFNPFVPEKKQIGRWHESFRAGLIINSSFQFNNTRLTRIQSYSEYKMYRKDLDGILTAIEAKPLTTDEENLLKENRRFLSESLQKKYDSLSLAVSNTIPIQGIAGLRGIIKENGQLRTTYSLPITLPNAKIARYINFSPSISYQGEIFTKKLEYEYVDSLNAVTIQTKNQVGNVYQWAVGGSFNTNVYGIYNFKKAGRLQAIRHTVSPTLGISYSPDLTSLFFQADKKDPNKPMVVRISKIVDTLTNTIKYDTLRRYLPRYENLTSTSGASGSISFGLTTVFEAKIKSKSDTAAKSFEKVPIVNMNVSTNYNILADRQKEEYPLSTIQMGASSNLFKNLINFTLSGTFDPYTYKVEADDDSQLNNLAGIRTNKYKIEDGFSFKNLASLANATFSMTTQLSPNKFKKSNTTNNSETSAKETLKKHIEDNPNLYVDFSIPWTLNLGYTLSYAKQGYAPSRLEQTVTVQGDLSLTPKWKIGFSTGWDFRSNSVTLTNININRELHCWAMAFNWTPISGYYSNPSYSFTLNVRSALLQELKVSRRRQYYGSGGF